MAMNKGDNPSDYTVDEVNAYLASADDAERQRVLDAESGDGGRQRTTVKAPASGDAAAATDQGNTGDALNLDPDRMTTEQMDDVEPGAKADTESASQGIETQDAPGSKTGSTGVVSPLVPAGQPVVGNPMADPEYAARANDRNDDSVPTPTQPGQAQTEDQKLRAIEADAEQQRAIAAAQGVDLDALRAAERKAAGLQ